MLSFDFLQRGKISFGRPLSFPHLARRAVRRLPYCSPQKAKKRFDRASLPRHARHFACLLATLFYCSLSVRFHFQSVPPTFVHLLFCFFEGFYVFPFGFHFFQFQVSPTCPLLPQLTGVRPHLLCTPPPLPPPPFCRRPRDGRLAFCSRSIDRVEEAQIHSN